jgi:hypothetical protein
LVGGRPGGKAIVSFDISDYKSRTGRLEWADLDLAEAFRERPLDEATLRCVRYMHDVEFHTICYLRDLLLTPAHNDPEITAFLTFWTFEEFWHGEALSAVLGAHGEPSGDERIAAVRTKQGLRSKLDPLITTVAGMVFKSDFIALHMTWGAINEWTTQAGYAQLARRANHPTLTALVQRIMKQEGRHIDFYATQARDRLAGSRRAQRLTRRALRRFWEPVGTGVMPQEETDFLALHLFGDEEGAGMAKRIDRRIDGLSGLAGLGLLGAARSRVVLAAQAPPAAQRVALLECAA